PKPEPEPEPEPEETPAPEEDVVPLPEPGKPKEPVVEKPKPKPVAEKPPQPMKKPQPKKIKPKKKPKEKEDKSDFDSVLKNLEKMKKYVSFEKEDSDSKKTGPSQKNVGNVGNKVTVSELEAVRRQLSRCWNIPAGAKDAHDLVIEVKVWLNKDGTLQKAKLMPST